MVPYTAATQIAKILQTDYTPLSTSTTVNRQQMEQSHDDVIWTGGQNAPVYASSIY